MYWADVYPTDRRSELEEVLRIRCDLGDPNTIATALQNLGLLENTKANYAEVCTILEEMRSHDTGTAHCSGSR